MRDNRLSRVNFHRACAVFHGQRTAQYDGEFVTTREERYSGEQIRYVAFTRTLAGKESNWPNPPLGDIR
jgi:hypothetical protein